MAFAPDVHVFPGGRVDPTDAHPSLVARSVVSPEAAAAALGGDLPPTQAIAAFIAAIRESFEEAGVLLADVGPGVIPRARSVRRGPPWSAARSGSRRSPRSSTSRCGPTGSCRSSRWVTPSTSRAGSTPGSSRPSCPDGAKATLEGDEVVEHAWLRPSRCARCDGRPASSAVAADEHDAPAARARRPASRPCGHDWRRARSARSRSTSWTREVVRIVMPAGGGVAGQPVNAYLVGRRSFVLVDPGDPTGPGLERAIAEAAARGGTIRAIALTHVDPDHAAGAEALASSSTPRSSSGPGGGRPLPYRHPRADRRGRDRRRRRRASHGLDARSATRPCLVPDRRRTGGAHRRPRWRQRGSRSIHGPRDAAAWALSLARLDESAPRSTRFGGHPAAT